MDWFVSGCNEVAYKALERFESEAWPRVTLIYGGSGLGKSSILWGMYHKVLAQRPGYRPRLLSARAFATKYALAAQNGTIPAFRRQIRSTGFLFVDDLQDLKGKEKTIEELLHTYDFLMEQGGKVVAVLCSEKLNLSFLGERLASRFLSGLTLRLYPPQPEELRGFARFYLQSKLALVEPEMAYGIAEGARTLTEIKQRCEAFLSYLEHEQTQPTVKELSTFRKVHEEASARQPVPENILKIVAEMYGHSLAEILGKRRLPSLLEARYLAIYCLKTICQISNTEIGRLFNKQHGAVNHALQTFEVKLAANSSLQARFEAIRQGFLNSL